MSPHRTPPKGNKNLVVLSCSSSLLYWECIHRSLPNNTAKRRSHSTKSFWENFSLNRDPKKICWHFSPIEFTQGGRSPVTLHWEHPRGRGGAGGGIETQVSTLSTQSFCWHRGIWTDAVGQAEKDHSRTARSCWGGMGNRQKESHVGDIVVSPAHVTMRHPCGPSLVILLMETLDNTAAYFNSCAIA